MPINPSSSKEAKREKQKTKNEFYISWDKIMFTHQSNPATLLESGIINQKEGAALIESRNEVGILHI